MNRIAGYALAAALASLFYYGWEICILLPIGSGDTGASFILTFAAVLTIFEGFGAALVAMSLAWVLAVILYRKVRFPGALYFTAVGAAGLLILGCAFASIAPQPLFVEDTTFREGFMIALDVQGIRLFISGAILGSAYWFLSERRSSR